MFKYSEIAQSIIHILEDEYKDIFAWYCRFIWDVIGIEGSLYIGMVFVL